MFVAHGSLVCSPSDLTAAPDCEFGWLRRLDEKLGRIDLTETAEDAMWERTGLLHEQVTNCLPHRFCSSGGG